jgi:hypothetical protein
MTPRAINLRGTSGCGKSHLVKMIMKEFPEKKPHYTKYRRQPIGYTLSRPDGDPLYVVGHYEELCGGCDTIIGLDAIYDEIEFALLELEMDTIFEGLIVCSDVERCISLKDISNLLVIELDTPLDECLSNIEERRYIRGDKRVVDPKHTIAKMDQLVPQRRKFKEAGVDFRLLDYKWAMVDVKEFLGLKVGQPS